jgi:hypothetical protein
MIGHFWLPKVPVFPSFVNIVEAKNASDFFAKQGAFSRTFGWLIRRAWAGVALVRNNKEKAARPMGAATPAAPVPVQVCCTGGL